MIPLADVGHHRQVAGIERQSLAQDAAAGRLQHRRINVGVEQDQAGALGSGAIVGVDAPPG
jgi:hypothetical protein